MNDYNVYVRSNKTIKTMSLTRLMFLIPLLVYSIYKNIVIYNNIINSVVILLGSIFIGVTVNYIYETFVKKSNKSFIDKIFSSFHLEYAILSACVTSIYVNLIIYFIVLFGILFISKFIKTIINQIALIFIIVYLLSLITGGFTYLSSNIDLAQLDYTDYLLGRNPGGLFATGLVFTLIAFIGMNVTNNIKGIITISATVSFAVLAVFGILLFNQDIYTMLFGYNYFFIFAFIATEFVTSSYTKKGMIVYGVAIGIITFILYFINHALAPYIAIEAISLLNIFIDKKMNYLENKRKGLV